MPRSVVRNIPYTILISGADGAANNALSCAFSASLNPTAAVTYEVWFNPQGSRKAFVLMDNSVAGVTTSPLIIIGSNGSISWYSTINGTTRNIVNATSKLVNWGESNMLTATYTGSAINLLLNGEKLTEEITGLSGAIGANSGSLRWGAYFSGGSGLTMQGYLYRPRLYAAGCTLAEHRARYFSNVTSNALQAALRLDCAMTEGSGSTSADVSGNGNTVTLGASASWSTVSPGKNRSAITTSRSAITTARTAITAARTPITP